ncbi:MAG: gamma carbonic anhydrase family protein, partial [Rhodospirillales bacterium]
MQGLVMPFKGRMPKLGADVFIAPTAAVIGDVEIGANSSIWFGVTLRGDVHEIRIGENTNIQDGSVVHVTGGKFGTYIGTNVTIGHNAIIHACTLEDGAFVGMGAI